MNNVAMMKKDRMLECGVTFTRNAKLAGILGWTKCSYYSINLMSSAAVNPVKPIKDHIFTANPNDTIILVNGWNKKNKYFKFYV